MIKRNKYSLILIVLAGVVFAGLNAAAWPKECFAQKEHSRKAAFERISEELDLSPGQKDEFIRMRRDNRGKMRDIRKVLKSRRRELRDELNETEIDKAKLRNIAAKIKELQSDMIDQRLERVLAMREILTPEQFTKFREKIKEHREKIGSKRRWGKGNFDKDEQGGKE